MLRKILVTLVVLIALAIATGAVYVAARQNLTFDAPYPAIAASTDSVVIGRGHYLANNVVNCSGCHGDTTRLADYFAGADLPLCGGYAFKIPPGTFYARNITPDAETGIGSFPDSAVARALRYGVGRDGRALLPFMEFQGLADDDLAAIISYLRAQPPVRNPVPAHHYNLLGKVLKATVLSSPIGPKETPLTTSPRGATVENGRYLVESAAHCGSCHTQRDMATGGFTGAHLAGSQGFPDDLDPSRTWSPPNITSDPETGKLGQLTEDEFVARFRAGRLLPGSVMPWQGLARLSEDDLRAIYRYLKTVPAVKNDVGPPVVEVKRKA